MKFSNWTLDSLIEYLHKMKHAPPDRLDYRCVAKVRGEIFVENGERRDGTEADDFCSYGERRVEE